MKRLKLIVMVAAAMIVAFITATVISEKIINRDIDIIIAPEEDKDLPIVYAEVAGIYINPMYGHVFDIEPGSIRDSITPVENNEFKLYVLPRGNDLSAVSYTLYDTAGRIVLETGSCISDKKVDQYIETDYRLGVTIANNTEYCFKLKLTTRNGEEFFYNTRLKTGENLRASEKMSFVRNFNKATFDKKEVNTVSAYMEPDGRITTDFSSVNIHASLDALSYGSMKVNAPEDISYYIKEINNERATITTEFSVKSAYGEQPRTYDIVECYRVKKTPESSRMILMSYKRTMEENETSRPLTVGENGIDIGIGEAGKVNYNGFETENESYIAFATDRAVWLYDKNANVITKIITFNSKCSLKDFAIRILAVEKTGDMYFIVYGRIPEGARAGQVGTSLYHYGIDDNRLNEIVFIPSTKGGEMLQKDVEKLNFISDNGLFYIMSGNSIYAVNYMDKTFEEAVANMNASSFAVEPDKGLLALYDYEKTGVMNSFNLVYLNSRDTRTIEASEGKLIGFIGFFSGDIIYGEGTEIYRERNGDTQLLYDKMIICDRNLDVKKVYEKEGCLIKDVNILDKSIAFNLVSKNADGSLQNQGEDYIISSNPDVSHTIKEEQFKDYVYGLERYVSFDDIVAATPISQNSHTEEKVEDNTVKFDMNDDIDAYYLYAEGRLLKEFTSVADAVGYANNTVTGSVLNRDNAILWQHSERSENAESISFAMTGGQGLQPVVQALMSYYGSPGEAAVDQTRSLYNNISNNITTRNAADLTGVDLAEALYNVWIGRPLIVEYEDGKYFVVVGFTKWNMYCINGETGGMEIWDINTNMNRFREERRQMVTIY